MNGITERRKYKNILYYIDIDIVYKKKQTY